MCVILCMIFCYSTPVLTCRVRCPCTSQVPALEMKQSSVFSEARISRADRTTSEGLNKSAKYKAHSMPTASILLLSSFPRSLFRTNSKILFGRCAGDRLKMLCTQARPSPCVAPEIKHTFPPSQLRSCHVLSSYMAVFCGLLKSAPI